jgi:putative FmdB family regulatory protein
MPLYEYRCQDCGETVEVIQKFSDPVLTVCKACGGRLERLLSAPAIQFKGSGWYVTDYARGGGRNGDSAKEPSKPSPEKTAATSDSTTSKAKAD